MKKKRFQLFLGLLLSWACLLNAQEIVKSSNGFETRLEQTFHVAAGGKLEIKEIYGDVTIESWNQNEVRIIEHVRMEVFTRDEAQEIIQRIQKNYKQSGNLISVRGIGSRKEVNSDYQIKVPEKFNLDINTSGGDVTAANIDGTVRLSSSGGDISLTNISGQSSVNTSGGDLEFRQISGRLDGSTSGGDIHLQDIYGETSVSTSGGDIVLVHATQQVSLRTSGGDISIENCEADVAGSTSGGDIAAIQVKGRLSVSTSGGDVKVEDCSGNQVSIQTSGGDISISNLTGKITANTSGGDIHGSALQESADVHTSGGDITLTNIQAPLRAMTSGGDIEVELTLTDFSKPHTIDLSTSGGKIILFLPEKIPATIQAEIELSGKSERWERYDIYSEFPLTKASPDETNGHVIRSNGEINGGGDSITLKTHNGNIEIKKLK